MLATGACGSDDTVADRPVRSYNIALEVDDSGDEYRYVAADSTPIDIRVGDEVTFELDNSGRFAHDLVVVDPNGQTIATAAAVAPGASTTLTVRFDAPGFHGLRCLVDDHLTTHGMQTFVEVTEPTP